MIITPHYQDDQNVRFTVDYGNGKIEEVQNDITSYLGRHALQWIGAHHRNYSNEFHKTRKAIGRKLDRLEDFDGLLDLLESASITFPPNGWVNLCTSLLKQLHKIIYHPQCPYNGPTDSSFTYVEDVVSWCSDALNIYWEDYGNLENKLYDFKGIENHITTLRSLDERLTFLEGIIREMQVPFLAKLVQHRDIDSSSNSMFSSSRWIIAVVYRHSLSAPELETIKRMLEELERIKDEQLKHTFLRAGIKEVDLDSLDEESSIPLLLPRMKQLQWEGTQVDLVCIMDCLKTAGFLTATDKDIVHHFAYGGTAQNRAKTYSDLRAKLREGLSHGNRTRVSKLIELLKGHIR